VNTTSSAFRWRSAGRRTDVLASLVLALGISATAAPTAWGADDDQPASSQVSSSTHDRSSDPTLTRTVSTPITRADAALARAKAEIRARHPGRAKDALSAVKANMIRANVAARNLIGKPPTDPESDDPPGPPAVLAAAALDHRIASGVVPPFNNQRRADLVDALGQVLTATQRQRGVMLDRVIGLPAEGDGDEYADGMADRLGQFTREVNQLNTALSTYNLTSTGRQQLNLALGRAKATKAKVDAMWGGGERSAL